MKTLSEMIVFYNLKHSKAETVKKFSGLNITRQGIYKILKRNEERGNVLRKPGSGRKISKMLKCRCKRLVSTAIGKTGQSLRKLGRKFNISKTHVARILQKEKIIYRKRKEAPKVNPGQRIRQEERIQILKDFVVEHPLTDFVLDDESYFTLTGSQQEGYYISANDKNNVPDEFRLKYRQKFCPKILVWAAVSKRGISSLLIRKSNSLALSSTIYVNECLKKHLVPFLSTAYPSGHYIFWPDLASCHYASATLEWLNNNKIPFLPKEKNPPCAPQIRPIERFWAHLKLKVYENGWIAENETQLARKIKKMAKTFLPIYFKNLFLHFTDKILCCAENGLNSII
jgi:transposase